MNNKQERTRVFMSSDESINAGTTSTLAIVETCVSVLAYWTIAWYFHTQLLLLVSAFAAPLLLLRSPSSIQRGLELFKPLVQTGEHPVKPLCFWVIVLLYFALLFIATNYVSIYASSVWLAGDASRVVISSSTFLGVAVAGAWSVATIGTLCRGPTAVTISGVVVIAGAVILALIEAVTASVSITVAMIDALGVAAAVVVAGYLGRSVVDAGVAAVAKATYTAAVVVMILMALAIVLGIINGSGPWLGAGIVTGVVAGVVIGLMLWALCASWLIRCVATLRFLNKGLPLLGKNWREVVWCTDFVHEPKLLPEAETLDVDFTASGILNRFQTANSFGVRIALVCLMLIWWVPAMAYRWSIKSTVWCWFWLVYLCEPPFSRHPPEESMERLNTAVSDIAKGYSEKFGSWVAWFGLIYGVSLYFPPAEKSWEALLGKSGEWSWMREPIQMMLPAAPGIRAVLLIVFTLLSLIVVVAADDYERRPREPLRLFLFKAFFKLRRYFGLLFACTSLLVGLKYIFPAFIQRVAIEKFVDWL